MTTDTDLRKLAFGVAYRMLGSVGEAEDVTQEALLRLHAAEDVEKPEAFLTTVATRLAIDVLRSARARREVYSGPWLPEPLVDDDPSRRVEEEETISLAFLVLLERLSPDERAVLVLRDAFDYDFADIAEIVGRSKVNTRQILSRARKRIAEDRPRFDPDPEERRALAARFLDAARGGDMEALLALLAPEAVVTGDGGGKARALSRPMVGAPAIARALLGFGRLVTRWGLTLEPALVNGQPGFVARDDDGRVVSVTSIDVVDGRVARMHSVANPDKLGHLGPVSDVGLRPGAQPS